MSLDKLMKKAQEEMLRLEKKEQLQTCFAADNLESRPTEKQLAVMKSLISGARYRYVSGGNQSAKSSVSIRELVWVLENVHPFWRKPTNAICNNRLCGSHDTIRWGHETVPRYKCNTCGNRWEIWREDEPYNIMLVGENNRNLYLNLWDSRIKPLLTDPDAWKPIKAGIYIAWIENKKTGDKIIFFPHSRGEEQVRKAVQGFTIHFVYGDEIAPKDVLEETQRRVDSKLGFWSFAFTIKGKQKTPELMRFMKMQLQNNAAVEFRFSMLDNPKYFGMKDEIEASLSGLTEEERNAVLYGDVDEFDDRVFSYTEDKLFEDSLPSNYSLGWRHVEIIDPALQSIAGYLIVAQDPGTKIWHVADAQYLKGMQDGLELFNMVQELSYKYNIVMRGSDNMAWFVGAAKVRGVKYKTPPHKQGKIQGGKMYLIKQFQIFMSEGRIRIPRKFEELVTELNTYRWQEGSDDKIVKSSKYHLLDCLFYFVDMLPKDEKELLPEASWDLKVKLWNRRRAGIKNGDSGVTTRNGSVKMYSGNDVRKLIDKISKTRRF